MTLHLNICLIYLYISRNTVVDFTKSRKSKISRKCEFQPIKSLEITLTITLTINLRLTTFCEIDPWCLTRFPYQMMFVSFNSNATGVIYGAGIVIPSGAHEFTLDFRGVCVARSFVFCVLFCRSLFLFVLSLLFIMLFLLLSIYGF